jgi:hypothetical protein
MRARWLAGWALIGVAVALACLAPSSGEAWARQGKKDKKKDKKGGKKGKDGAGGKDLKKAYDQLTEVAVLLKVVGARAPAGVEKKFEQAKGYYRAGLKHWLRATVPPVADLPPPPEGAVGSEEPWERARRELERARLRISETERETAGKAFLDGSRTLYAQARAAYLDKEFLKASELARGAEAWTHVGEHLRWGGLAGPEPIAVPPALGPAAPPPPPPLK